jgi:YVTN family beta-propeller protein
MDHETRPDRVVAWPLSIATRATLLTLMMLTACGGEDSESEVNSPLSTPMAFVVNQDDTTVTTIRLDGKGAPVINTLSLGPARSDVIGGVTFSLGEWIFVTHTAGNRVAFIDPIGALAPILEDFLDASGDPKVGQRPKRVYRDPLDKEILWTMNEGDPGTGIDAVANCPVGGSTTVLHNSHIAIGGEKPHIRKTPCLFGKGEQFAAFSRPTAANPGLLQRAFISSKTTGLVSVVTADATDGANRWSALIPIDLCDNAKEACDGSPFTANTAAPAGMFWSQLTGKVYAFLSGYSAIVEIDPVAFVITRRCDVALPPPSTTIFHSMGMTPDGQFLFLVGEDLFSDQTKVIGKFGVVDLTQPVLSLATLSIPQLDNIRPATFQFTPNGTRLYLTQSNTTGDLAFAAQVHNLKKDKLLVFSLSTLPAAPLSLAELSLPPANMHAMDLWITGPQAAGSAKAVVVTNATPGVNGSVTLIDAATNAITQTIPVGRNPKQVTVYYVGLAASDNQATPIW